MADRAAMADVRLGAMSTMDAVWMLSPALLPLMVSIAGALVVQPRAAHMMGPQTCKKRLTLRY